jgi:hypothetical protein
MRHILMTNMGFPKTAASIIAIKHHRKNVISGLSAVSAFSG